MQRQHEFDQNPYAQDVFSQPVLGYARGTVNNYIAPPLLLFLGGAMALEAAPIAIKLSSSALQGAAEGAQNPTLREIVTRLYQAQDRIPGGTAGAIRNHLATGEWISNSGHFIKTAERLAQLGKLIQSGTLSATDMAIAKSIAADLRNALGR
jgi:hypothetical protein